MKASKSLISVSLSNLLGVGSLGTKDLLISVLLLLSLLSRRLLNLLSQTVSDQSVGWLESLGVSNGLVDQTETGRLSSTELGSETENRDSVLVGLVQLSQSFSQLILGDVSSVWVQDVNDELSSGQQWVGDNLSSSDSNGVTSTKLVIRSSAGANTSWKS
ncbi:hypothetical protein CLUG_04538 [Clavispora lusitaniae ATCC 42720]|uniref:Uncharacterized protein n=1 Tax=Clavispora lusitaniae (strain ATCC 42720) TaxID=306902 RepID=C4Y8L0_CLAL4|nr:uncharacterized protein CLUG_04538 [Clavispora lusitaniae ATCC 42720]EEQ40410.1 hypothetical protein CLUG_04538 [Clavispora lusitaniae ATCC 42720]